MEENDVGAVEITLFSDETITQLPEIIKNMVEKLFRENWKNNQDFV